ncbi:MAG: T9SS type A sorting domain-containing protein [Ferruginibacter sp.]
MIKSNVVDLVGLLGTSVYWGFSAGCYCVTGAPAVSNIILNGTVLLPLDLTSFNAEKNNNTIKLIWQTAMENNTAYFDVEKSNDGRTFYFLQKVTAAGFSSAIKNYTATDASPLYGNGYYRLKMVDKDGRINYSNIVVVKMIDKTSGVNIFPNPVRNELQLQIPSDKNEIATIQIEDAAGRIVQTKTLQLNGAAIYTSLNTSLLVPGMYLLNVKREGKQEVKKFIKQ